MRPTSTAVSSELRVLSRKLQINAVIVCCSIRRRNQSCFDYCVNCAASCIPNPMWTLPASELIQRAWLLLRRRTSPACVDRRPRIRSGRGFKVRSHRMRWVTVHRVAVPCSAAWQRVRCEHSQLIQCVRLVRCWRNVARCIPVWTNL